MQPIYCIFQLTFLHAKLTTSASIDNDTSNYQPGGTFIAIVGCYAACILTTGSNDTSLGRWTYNELISRNDKHFLIVNAYHIGNQQPTIGSWTICTQQYQILLQQGQLNPNPRKQFVSDFITLIQQWQCTHKILVCLDANDTVLDSDNHSLDRILEATNLINLHGYRFPNIPTPATHNWGSKTIDYCFGSTGFAQALTCMWILPFGMPLTLSGNHYTLGLEFDHDILFGQKIHEIGYQRGIYSNAYPTVWQFNDMVAKACKDHNLFWDIQNLANKYQFTVDDHTELEWLDKALMKILVKADKKYARHCNSPWSIELHQAFLHHCYWTTKLMQARTKRNHSDMLKSIAAKLSEPPDKQGSLTLNLRKVQETIHKIKCAAASKQESYLQELTEAASNANGATKQKLILHLCLVEQDRKFCNPPTIHEATICQWHHKTIGPFNRYSTRMEYCGRPKSYWIPPHSVLPKSLQSTAGHTVYDTSTGTTPQLWQLDAIWSTDHARNSQPQQTPDLSPYQTASTTPEHLDTCNIPTLSHFTIWSRAQRIP